MNDELLTPHPERQLVYTSSTIFERRKRILREARNMITEGGIEGFSVRTLCKRADVAQRTLYNAFHSKDRLIALAIRDAYEDFNRTVAYGTSPETIDGIIDRLIVVNLRNLKARHYTRAVTSIFFAPGTSRDIWSAIREMAFLNLRKWLERLKQDDELQHWADVSDLEHMFANIEYSVINDWANDRISDERFIPLLITSVLSFAVGVTKGPTHDHAKQMLSDIGKTGNLPQFA